MIKTLFLFFFTKIQSICTLCVCVYRNKLIPDQWREQYDSFLFFFFFLNNNHDKNNTMRGQVKVSMYTSLLHSTTIVLIQSFPFFLSFFLSFSIFFSFFLSFFSLMMTLILSLFYYFTLLTLFHFILFYLFSLFVCLFNLITCFCFCFCLCCCCCCCYCFVSILKSVELIFSLVPSLMMPVTMMCISLDA